VNAVTGECLFCSELPLRCPEHQIPHAKTGEAMFTCSICNEKMLAVDTANHVEVHIQEAVMGGFRDNF